MEKKRETGRQKEKYDRFDDIIYGTEIQKAHCWLLFRKGCFGWEEAILNRAGTETDTG